MLFRVNLTRENGPLDLLQSKALADVIASRGMDISFAVNKDGYDLARHLLGDEASLHRLPSDEEGELTRLAHLKGKGNHRNIFINLRHPSSTYLFNVTKVFKHTSVMHQGGDHLIYADLCIDDHPQADMQPHNCGAETKLLLGPKFFLGPRAPRPDEVRRNATLLIAVGNDADLIVRLLEGCKLLRSKPRVHVLANPDAYLKRKLAAFRVGHPDWVVAQVEHPMAGLFPFYEYPMVITRPGRDILLPLYLGTFCMTTAKDASELKQSYELEQVGLAPSLGWPASVGAQGIAEKLTAYFDDPLTRGPFTAKSRQFVDGEGVMRVATMIPAETEAQAAREKEKPERKVLKIFEASKERDLERDLELEMELDQDR